MPCVAFLQRGNRNRRTHVILTGTGASSSATLRRLMSPRSDSVHRTTPRRAWRSDAALVAAFGLVAMLSSGAVAQSPLQVARMSGGAACVALTFDDGPDIKLTPQLLA